MSALFHGRGLPWRRISSVRALVAIGLLAGVVLVPSSAASAATLVASLPPPAPNNFGHSVSISGNYAIVGATGYNCSSPSAGGAYIYKRSGATWSLQATLPGPITFGTSVGISGRYAIVGAEGCSGTGAAYIYKRVGATWPLQAALPLPAGTTGAGYSVSISGSYAIVGTEDFPPAGAAFIYKRVGATWPAVDRVILPDPQVNVHDGFGAPVSISGNTAVVSSMGANSVGCSAPPCGAVDVYARNGATWPLKATLSDPGATQNDYFGETVAVQGTLAPTTVVVGDENGQPCLPCTATPPVYIFEEPSAGWANTSTPTAKIITPGAITLTGGFGPPEVAISGHATGHDSVVIGSPSVNSLRGSAYIYVRTGGVWPAAPTVAKTPATPSGAGNFGISVGISISASSQTSFGIVGAPGGSGDTFIFKGV